MSQNSETTLTKTFAQKLYKMYTQITLNSKYVYILHTQIVKISYDHKCTRNVLQIPTYIHKMYKLYKTCKKGKLKLA